VVSPDSASMSSSDARGDALIEAGGEIGAFLKGWNKPVIRRADMVVGWSES
jgi:hypothetical protein